MKILKLDDLIQLVKDIPNALRMGANQMEVVPEEDIAAHAAAMRAAGHTVVGCSFCSSHHPNDHARACPFCGELVYPIGERPKEGPN